MQGIGPLGNAYSRPRGVELMDLVLKFERWTQNQSNEELAYSYPYPYPYPCSIL